MSKNNILKLVRVMELLRHPEKGCQWDKKQTLETIIPHSIEEVYEVAHEIYNKNYANLKEELGDLLFQVVYISQIAKEKNKFDFNDVVNAIIKKMIFRHPHVFKNKKFNNDNDLNEWWEKSKSKKQKGLLDNLPKSIPSFISAYKIQKKVSKVGFDYKTNIDAINKVIEEANELKKEIKFNNKIKIKEELGDLIFSCLDVSRKLEMDPEMVLYKANKKFIKRWKKIELYAKKNNQKLKDLTIKEFENYWQKAKI